ncbi:alpha-(1-_3)-arabinofuranosyltransferase [Mumia sp. DW29H23]|uniref:alpha-(1->3)-arabinofuranosyltransferase n=1 Tax=Mumia sp. DW29H23 TaxID=3421241 RepID=UPI003D68A5AE
MEPRDRPAQTLTRDGRLTWRFRLAAVSLGLVALAFVQTPGRILTDTKLDLVIDPGGFLGRALTLWDPVGAFGQVQNQAYGYLFPMGPFFLLGDLARLEPWVIQRLWWSLLLVTAFLGIVKLAGALRIGAPWARIVAGLAYALSPRMLSVIGPSSIEVWPMALAPWVLVPLVIGMRRHDPRWMAALSALAVACVGGVNAVATFAVIPLGALWLLLAPASPRRRSMMIWWPVFVLLGTLWWLVPLFLLGEYSPPFLDYIESASTTTFAATLFDALRGTSNWVPYVDANSVAGNDLLRSIGLIVNGAVVVALGIVGVARRGTPHRRFLLCGLVLGLVLLTLGHTGVVHGWGAESVQHALDGLLSPLRNTHKFDLVVRIPLVLGLAAVLSGIGAKVRDADGARTLRTGVAVLGVAAVVGATVPAWTGNLANRGTFDSVPGYWREAATWLDTHDSGQRALLVPASAFGDYLWGRTGDDVLQPLADSPWAVRNAIPLAPGGNIRTLDAIERRLASGEGSEGLARFLERSGVRYLVVRNDLSGGTEHTDPERVYATLADTPGVTSVAQFGPTMGSPAVLTDEDGEDVLIKDGWQAVRPAVEIFAVGSSGRSPVSVQDAESTPVVAGGPESLLTLDELGDLGGSAVLADDLVGEERPEQVVLTDGARRQEAAFGRAEQNRSASLAENEPYSLDRPVHDYRVSPHERFVSVPRLVGATRLTASSSQSDAGSPGPVVPGEQPWSAFDGDPRTTWRAGAGDAETSWLELELGGPADVDTISVTLDPSAERARRLTVRTDAGEVAVTAQPGVATTVDLPAGATRSIRVAGAASAFDPLALTEVEVPGLEVTRPLVMPRLPSDWGAPDEIVMTVDQAYRSGCLDVEGATRCVADREEWGEDGRVLDRELELGGDASYDVRLEVAPVGGAAFDAAAQQGRLAVAAASSYLVEDSRNSVVRAIDANPDTGWVASADDTDPTLTLAWVGERRVSRVAVTTHRDLSASEPREARLVFPDGTEREVTFVDGVAQFAPVRAQSVEIHFGATDEREVVDAFGTRTPLPVGVSEIRLPSRRAVFPQPPRADDLVGRCGNGPAVEIDGRRFETRVRTSGADLLSAQSFAAEICGIRQVDLTEGKHRVRIVGNDVFRPLSLTLGGLDGTAESTAATPTTWGRTSRTVPLDGRSPSDRLVTVAENGNAGWDAPAGATPVQVNGWQQGWVVDGDQEKLALTYAPSTRYRAALVFGGLTFLALLALTLLRRRVRSSRPEERRGRSWGVLAGVCVAAGLLAGTVGVAVAVVAWLVGGVVRARSDEAIAWLAGAPVLVATVAYAVRPWGTDTGWAGDIAWPQLLVVASLGLLSAAVVGGVRLRPTLRRRRAGSSTTR